MPIYFYFPPLTTTGFSYVTSAGGKDPKASSGGSSRTKEEITSAILEAADKSEAGLTKMLIMAHAFITYETATGYIEKLVGEGLMEYHPDTKTYSTTELEKEECR